MTMNLNRREMGAVSFTLLEECGKDLPSLGVGVAETRGFCKCNGDDAYVVDLTRQVSLESGDVGETLLRRLTTQMTARVLEAVQTMPQLCQRYIRIALELDAIGEKMPLSFSPELISNVFGCIVHLWTTDNPLSLKVTPELRQMLCQSYISSGGSIPISISTVILPSSWCIMSQGGSKFEWNAINVMLPIAAISRMIEVLNVKIDEIQQKTKHLQETGTIQYDTPLALGNVAFELIALYQFSIDIEVQLRKECSESDAAVYGKLLDTLSTVARRLSRPDVIIGTLFAAANIRHIPKHLNESCITIARCMFEGNLSSIARAAINFLNVAKTEYDVRRDIHVNGGLLAKSLVHMMRISTSEDEDEDAGNNMMMPRVLHSLRFSIVALINEGALNTHTITVMSELFMFIAKLESKATHDRTRLSTEIKTALVEYAPLIIDLRNSYYQSLTNDSHPPSLIRRQTQTRTQTPIQCRKIIKGVENVLLQMNVQNTTHRRQISSFRRAIKKRDKRAKCVIKPPRKKGGTKKKEEG